MQAEALTAALGPPQFERIGRVDGRYSVKRTPQFAIVELGPAQYKVSPDDLVISEKLKGVDVNDRLELGRVLMLGSRSETIIGRPHVLGASVTAVVEEQFQDAKVTVFKKRRRKNSRRTMGHRQELTSLRIVGIHGFEAPEAESPAAVAAAA
ncbi:hypothetical protein WJX81_003172 [Elliptochloris bilobata]|uniref:Large ribosomal subunit protein bL21m n=1 Tax=Elliptochloris bilobata TaxID=381761 RepID=A0AAW1QL11_9CHLO